MAELEECRAEAAVEEQNKDLIKRYIEEFNKADIQIYESLLKEDFQGIPAKGNKFVVGCIWILQIKDGKIIEDRTDMDTLGFAMQLGMELSPKEEK